MPNISVIFVAVGTMLLVGAFSNKLSSRFNVPILLIFLLFGMFVGYGYTPEEWAFDVINVAGTIAMCFILFSGGLNTKFSTICPVLLPGGILATVGVLLTSLFFAVCAFGVLYGKLSFAGCMLLGAMISSTDAAAVFGILSGRSVGLKGKLRPLLELESGSNDPMAYFLTLLMIDVVLGKTELGIASVMQLLYRMAGGIALGLVVGMFGKLLYKTKLEYEGLYFVFDIAIVVLSYGLAEGIQANGMMACYICGITMNHCGFHYQKGITRFSDGVSWLMQVILFTTLGIFVDVGGLPEIAWRGCVLAGILLFIARPAAIFLSLAGQSLNWREKLLISWVGLRGAAPIVLATFPLACGMQGAKLYFNLIFFMVLVSMLVQGTTMMYLAKLLKLDKPFSGKERLPLELESTPQSSGHEMKEFTVPEDAPYAGKTVAELALPNGVLITLIRRGSKLVPPNGQTVIHPLDGLLIMGTHENILKVREEFFPAED